MTASGTGIALEPGPPQGLDDAIRQGGGRIVAPTEADALVWTEAGDPEALGKILATSPARWVQLPFAGVEGYFAAGVIDAARTWTCAKGAYGSTTAEHALALLLASARRLDLHLRSRTWINREPESPERALRSQTVAIVGTGGIGAELARLLAPLGSRLLGINRSGRPLEGAVRTVTHPRLHEVLGEADFVVVAAPLTAETRGMFDSEALGAMKPAAWLVNVARGAIVDTGALLEALSAERLGGAALDVTDPEPLPDEHPLWSLPNVIVTPHVANTWSMSLVALRALVRRNVAHWVAGEPLESRLDPELGY